MNPGRKTDFRPAAAAGFAAVVLLSAGVVAPLTGEAEAEARARASVEAREIAAALRDYLGDCETAFRSSGGPTPTRLYGPGVLPIEDASSIARPSFPLSALLVREEFGVGAVWRGPYLERMPVDPWGRAWIVRLDDDGRGSVRVLSAGDDGVLDTPLGGAIDPRDVGAELLR